MTVEIAGKQPRCRVAPSMISARIPSTKGRDVHRMVRQGRRRRRGAKKDVGRRTQRSLAWRANFPSALDVLGRYSGERHENSTIITCITSTGDIRSGDLSPSISCFSFATPPLLPAPPKPSLLCTRLVRFLPPPSQPPNPNPFIPLHSPYRSRRRKEHACKHHITAFMKLAARQERTTSRSPLSTQRGGRGADLNRPQQGHRVRFLHACPSSSSSSSSSSTPGRRALAL